MAPASDLKNMLYSDFTMCFVIIGIYFVMQYYFNYYDTVGFKDSKHGFSLARDEFDIKGV